MRSSGGRGRGGSSRAHLILSFYRGGNWGPERESEMPKVTLYLGVRADCGHTGVTTCPVGLTGSHTATRSAHSQSRHTT